MGLGIAFAELFMLMDLYGDVLSQPVKMGVYGLMFGLFVSGLYSLADKAGIFNKSKQG
jgi:hypothetical protein